MTKTLLRFVTRSVLFATCIAGSLSAATISYTVSNFTASGGDPTYSVASDLTFNNLSLRETFTDGTSSTLPLFDFTNTVQTSLNSLTLTLNSQPVNTVDPAHGLLVGASLSGNFSSTNVSILTSFGGTPVPVVISANFSAALPINSTSTNINAISGNAVYAAGTLQSRLIGSSVPEATTLAVSSLGLLGLLALGRRRTAR